MFNKLKLLSKQKGLNGKTVLLRADFDVPHAGDKILDDYRIRMALPTIKFLQEQGAKVVVISKSGKPKKGESAESLRVNAEHLANLLGLKFVQSETSVPNYDARHLVFFTGDIRKQESIEAVKKAALKDLVVLENIRFYPEETEPSTSFAKHLSQLGDIYVNDAFAMMHRNEASVSLLPKYIPGFAGLNVEKEVNALDTAMKLKVKPFVLIVGGAKISDKVGTIKNLAKNADHILVGGGPANLFLLAKGYKIGKSICEKEQLKVAEDLLRNYKEKIVLPVDLVVADPDDFNKVSISKLDKVKDDQAIYDLGPQTILLYSKYIKAAKKMIWNGPMGYFEQPQFSHATKTLALIFASRSKGSAYGLIGGGDTAEAVGQSKVIDQIDFVSTAGGATLNYLAGEHLPGLEALK